MNMSAVGLVLLGLTIAAAQADPHAADSKVVRIYVEKPDSDETGPLHIVHSDGVDVVQTVPPTEPPIEFGQAGFSDLLVASDQKTVGLV